MHSKLPEKSNAENLQDFAQTPGGIQLFLQDGYEHVNAQLSPNLRLHRNSRYLARLVDRLRPGHAYSHRSGPVRLTAMHSSSSADHSTNRRLLDCFSQPSL